MTELSASPVGSVARCTHDAVPATWVRGGTSKCWIFRADDLPDDAVARDAVLLRAFGSPDQRQIDGVGGGSSTTSKAIVLHAADQRPGVITYQVGQVSVDRTRVEWDSNCGNCASALALYAVQERLVPLSNPVTGVELINLNTGLELGAIVTSPEPSQPSWNGSELVPGTPFPGVRVVLRWTPPTWSEFGKTLPTGQPADLLEVDGRTLRVSIIDAGAPAVLVKSVDLGLGANPGREPIDAILPLLAKIRSAAALKMSITRIGLQSIPKVGVLSASTNGSLCDLEARMVSMAALHPAIGITSAIAIATAVTTPGTTANELARSGERASGRRHLSIGTLAGPVGLEVECDSTGAATGIECVRSARRLADATIHLRDEGVGIVGANLAAGS